MPSIEDVQDSFHQSLRMLRRHFLLRRPSERAVGKWVDALEPRELLSTTYVALTSSTAPAQAPIVKPSHIVVVIEEDRGANAIGDLTNMPYINQLASTGLVYENSHGLNTVSQEGEMSYLGLFSGETQGVTDDSNHGMFSGNNLAQTLASKGKSFSEFAESLPHAGDTTDTYAADPTHPAYDDLYARAFNPAAQFSQDGTGVTNAQVNQPFGAFPTTAAGFAKLPTVSFVTPNTLHNTHGSNDTNPFATDPSAYNLLRQNADTWLQQNLNGYLQWAKKNNSLLIITDDEGDRAHNFAGGFATIVNGASGLYVPGVDPGYVTPYNILRTIENMYGLPDLGNSGTASGLDINASGKLSAPQPTGNSVVGQPVTFKASVLPTTPSDGTPTGTVQFVVNGKNYGSPVTLSKGSATSPAINFTTPGTYSVSADYGSTAAFSASLSPTLLQTVAQDKTSTTLASSSLTSAYGKSVTFTATVIAAAPGTGKPTGKVTFRDGAATLGTIALSTSGNAAFTTSVLGAGLHTITAAYSGDTNFLTSTSSAAMQTIIPPNDNFANAATLYGSYTKATATNVGATKEPGEPAHAGNAGGKSVWWTWKAPATGVVTLDTSGSNFNTLLAVYTGTSVSLLKAVPSGSNDNDPAGGKTTSKVSFAVTVGTVYRIAVDGYNGASGSITLHLLLAVIPAAPTGLVASKASYSNKVHLAWSAPAGATSYEIWRGTSGSTSSARKISTAVVTTTTYDDTTAAPGITYWYWVKAKNIAGTSGFSASAQGYLKPVNDNFTNAAVITGKSATITGSNLGATKETGEPKHAGNAGGTSVWWFWTAPSSGTVTIDTHGSSFNTLLAVYTGSSVSALTAMTGGSDDNDPAGGTLTSKVSFKVTAGIVYRIAVDGSGGAVGNITLHLNLT